MSKAGMDSFASTLVDEAALAFARHGGPLEERRVDAHVTAVVHEEEAVPQLGRRDAKRAEVGRRPTQEEFQQMCMRKNEEAALPASCLLLCSGLKKEELEKAARMRVGV